MACFAMAKRKCKKCGRTFESKGTGDLYCSALCRMTGYFVGGGGDTSKPGVDRPTAEKAAPVKPMRIKKDDERFARVRRMFDLPPKDRWNVAKDFSEEERAYARRLARKQLMDDDRFTREWDWNSGDDEDDEPSFIVPSTIGDSDDGSV